MGTEQANHPNRTLKLEREQDIVRRVAKGDRKATRALYGDTICRMTSVCSRYVDDPDAVNDVLQESYLSIFSTIGKFQYKGEGSLLAWMTRIVAHQSIDRVKRDVRRGAVELPGDLPETIDDDTAEHSNLSADAIHSIIRQMPAGYRAVFNMYVLDGMSHKQIASELGITENTSASQLARAKAWLKNEVKQHLIDNR